MSTSYNVLILGASYGSLLATKLAMAGHNVKLVCLPAEAAAINQDGAVVRLPVKGREGLVEVNSRNLPGDLAAGGTEAFDPAAFDPGAATVRVTGKVFAVERRVIRFEVEAFEGERKIGDGRHARGLVNAETFTKRLAGK